MCLSKTKTAIRLTLEGVRGAQPLQHSKLVLLQAAQCEGWGSVHNRDPVMIGSFPHSIVNGNARDSLDCVIRPLDCLGSLKNEKNVLCMYTIIGTTLPL
jgi:hypothetical protein